MNSVTFAQWRKSVVGRLIDIDGWYGAQCWDLWADYAIRVHGAEKLSTFTSANAGRDSGLAGSLWSAFPARAGIDRQFTRLGRDTAIRAGDVLVWSRSANFPDSHVAIATGNLKPGYAECVTQNDGSAAAAAGAARVGWLPLGGLYGLLRPKTTPPNPSTDDLIGDDMPWILVLQRKHYYLIQPKATGKAEAILLGAEANELGAFSKLPQVPAYSAQFTMDDIKRTINGIRSAHLKPLK